MSNIGGKKMEKSEFGILAVAYVGLLLIISIAAIATLPVWIWFKKFGDE